MRRRPLRRRRGCQRNRGKFRFRFRFAPSALRLVGSLLIEENERWAARRRLYYGPAVEQLERKASELVKIARIQQRLRKAA